VGGTSARQNTRKFLRFELAIATSQTFKYDVITYAPFEGMNYTILDKIKHYEIVSVNHLEFK